MQECSQEVHLKIVKKLSDETKLLRYTNAKYSGGNPRVLIHLVAHLISNVQLKIHKFDLTEPELGAG